MIKLQDLLSEMELSESIYDRGLFKCIFFSGIPGAGKSYVLSQISDGSIDPRVVNTDKYTEFLSKRIGHDISGEYDVYVDTIKRVTVNQLANYVNGALPLFVDGTSNSASSLFRREGILKALGYDTGMVWIDTDVEVALSRIGKRNRKVPEQFVRDVYAALNKNKEYYRSHFKFFVEVKNNVGELTNDVLTNAYKQTQSFYNGEIQNPIGIENKAKMDAGNGYLVNSVLNDNGSLLRRLNGWYN